MKNSAIIKNSVFAALSVAGLNMLASCDGCTRKDDTTGNGYATQIHDTVYIDTCLTPHDSVMRDGSKSGVYVPVGKRPTDNAASTANGNGAGNGQVSEGNNKPKLTEEQITNRVENSSSKATKNGKPVISSGTSGSGQGTGTGSTGNNSRVTTKEDQLRN